MLCLYRVTPCSTSISEASAFLPVPRQTPRRTLRPWGWGGRGSSSETTAWPLCVLVIQSCLTLCDPMNCSPPISSVHGILQARILEWVAVPSSRGSSLPKDRTCVPYASPSFLGKFFTTSTIWEAPCGSKTGPSLAGNTRVSWSPVLPRNKFTSTFSNLYLFIYFAENLQEPVVLPFRKFQTPP